MPDKSPGGSAASAQDHSKSSYGWYGAPKGNDPRIAAALAQERHHSSYGEPEPLTVPAAPVPSDETPWLPIALSIAVALAIVAATGTQLRRVRIRRRAARAMA